MKKIILNTLLILSFVLVNSQNLKTDKFEVYLNDYEVSEIAISQGMYMTKNMQYFYEGVIEVLFIETNTTKNFRFFYSKWDEVSKEFSVKDMNYNSLSANFNFTDNKHIKFLGESSKMVTKALLDTTDVEYVILSSMMVWLENFKLKKE